MLPHRLQREADDDAAYRGLVAQLGTTPLFPHHSVQREKNIVVGEVIGHLVALVLGAALWRKFGLTQYVFFATWGAAFFADWIGGMVALAFFTRRQPSVVEIADQLASRGHSKSEDPQH